MNKFKSFFLAFLLALTSVVGAQTQHKYYPGIDPTALAHYIRVKNDGGHVESLATLNQAVKDLKAAYNDSLKQKLAAAIDPSIFGYKYRTDATGTYCVKAYSLMGASSDVVQTTASAQPLLLRYEGVKYGYLPGVAANSYSTPDAAALDITGDIALAIDLELKTAMTSGAHTLGGKANGAGQISYYLGVATGGFATLTISLDGTALTTYTSNAAAYSATGRISIAAERNSTTGDVTFYTGSELAGWTQLGSVIAGASGAIFASTATLVVGGVESGVNTNALKYYGFQVYSGTLSGTLVAYFQPSLYDISVAQATFTDVTTKVWTINRSTATTGYKAQLVYRTTTQGDAVDDGMTSSVLNLVQPFTMYGEIDQLSWVNLRRIYGGSGPSAFINQFGVTPDMSMNAGTTLLGVGSLLNRLQGVTSVFDGINSEIIINGLSATGNAGAQGAGVLFFYSQGSLQANATLNTLLVSKQKDSTPIISAVETLRDNWNGNPLP